MLTYIEHKNCNAAPLHMGATQAAEYLPPSSETAEPFNKHKKPCFGTSDMQGYSIGPHVSM